MTIESDMASIKIHLGRIADALEGLLAEQGFVPTGPTSIEEEDVADPDEKPKDNSHKKPPAINAEKKTKKKKADVVVGKPEPDDDAVEWTIPLLRNELHKLQEQENQAAVKSILKKFGASTLGQVDKKKYAQLADAIADKLDE